MWYLNRYWFWHCHLVILLEKMKIICKTEDAASLPSAALGRWCWGGMTSVPFAFHLKPRWGSGFVLRIHNFVQVRNLGMKSLTVTRGELVCIWFMPHWSLSTGHSCVCFFHGQFQGCKWNFSSFILGIDGWKLPLLSMWTVNTF